MKMDPFSAALPPEPFAKRLRKWAKRSAVPLSADFESLKEKRKMQHSP